MAIGMSVGSASMSVGYVVVSLEVVILTLPNSCSKTFKFVNDDSGRYS